MKLQILLIICVLSGHLLSSPCTTTDQIRFLQCKGGILKIQELLRQYAQTGDKLPPQSTFKTISKLCTNALTCVEQIQCQEAKRGVGLMTSACGGIEMSAGPFGDCMAKLQANPPDVSTYPCANMFDTDALDSKYKKCKLFTEHAECVERLAKDQCGSPAVEAFRKNVHNMKMLLKC